MKRVLISLSMLLILSASIPAHAQDCVDVELGAEVITGDPYDILSLYFSAENCGTEPGMVTFTSTLTIDLVEVGTVTFQLYMPAGEPFIQELGLPILDILPPGVYMLCITAELGTATDTACASITLGEANEVMSFSPLSPTGNEDSSWGAIKTLHK